jgi:hypothetical protein
MVLFTACFALGVRLLQQQTLLFALGCARLLAEFSPALLILQQTINLPGEIVHYVH